MLDWLCDSWTWLWSATEADLSRVEILATGALSLMALLATLVGTWIAYRSFFGWKPLLFITKRAISNGSSAPGGRDVVGVAVRIWNRRKYEVVVEAVTIDVKHLDLDWPNDEQPFRRVEMDERRLWSLEDGKLLATDDELVRAGERADYEVATYLRTPLKDNLPVEDVMASVTAMIYDPLRNRRREVKTNDRHHSKLVRQIRKKMGWPLQK